MHRSSALFVLIAFLLTGCVWQISAPGSGTATPFIITSTLPPTVIPSATLTPEPPTLTPTTVPVEGMTTTQVNVRAEPSSASTQLGMLAPFVKVEVTGSDAGGDWYQIQYPQGPSGNGWVTSQYINIQKGKDTIPTISALPGTEATPNATGTPASGGSVIQQVNVRKGPGTDFDSLGTLNAKDPVALIGKDSSSTWLQIRYAAGPEGKGWVAATYVKTGEIESLPIIAESGAIVGTGTTANTQSAVTPTPVAALQDNDSAEVPAAKVQFSPTGTHSLIYSSDVSTPHGDAEDWIQFTPYGSNILLSLTCAGNGKLKVSLAGNGLSIQDGDVSGCGESRLLAVAPGQMYLAQISILPGGDGLEYVRYTLRVESMD